MVLIMVVVTFLVRGRAMNGTAVMRVVAHPFVMFPIAMAVPIPVAMPAKAYHNGGAHHLRLRIALFDNGTVNHCVIYLSESGSAGQ